MIADTKINTKQNNLIYLLVILATVNFIIYYIFHIFPQTNADTIVSGLASSSFQANSYLKSNYNKDKISVCVCVFTKIHWYLFSILKVIYFCKSSSSSSSSALSSSSIWFVSNFIKYALLLLLGINRLIYVYTRGTKRMKTNRKTFNDQKFNACHYIREYCIALLFPRLI